MSKLFYFTFDGIPDSQRYRSLIACHRAAKAHRAAYDAKYTYRIVNDKTGESLPCQFTNRNTQRKDK